MASTITEASQEARDRAAVIDGLRNMAAWLEDHPGVPVSKYAHIEHASFPSLDEARATMAAAPGGWEKGTSATSNYTSYTRQFGDTVAYAMHVPKDQTCERVQVGTEHVEAHDKPVYEWRCGDGNANG